MQAPPAAQTKGSASFTIESPAPDPEPQHYPQPSTFPENLPVRAKTTPTRRISFFRFLWYVRFGAYSFRKLSADSRHGSVARIRWRRFCMIWIVLMRLAISIEFCITSWYLGVLIAYVILSVFSFWSTFACLTHIGDAEGTRRELGMNIVSLSPPSIDIDPTSLTFATLVGQEVAGYFPLCHGWPAHRHRGPVDLDVFLLQRASCFALALVLDHDVCSSLDGRTAPQGTNWVASRSLSGRVSKGGQEAEHCLWICQY